MLRKKLKLSPTDNTLDSKSTENSDKDTLGDIPEKFLQYEKHLSERLSKYKFSSPVHYVYNPLQYAWDPHANFVNTYCTTRKDILFLGLNPGPWGMCQTGVPFGEIKACSEWLKVTGDVSKPNVECPKKEIKGFQCHRTEESGKRFYGFFKNLCSSPEQFFKHSFVYNLCPLAFMKKESANITPQELKGQVKKELEQTCGEVLVNILKLLDTKIILALGRYTEKQAKDLIDNSQLRDIRVIYMPHPSPRVVGNENWPEKAKTVIVDNDLLKYFTQS